MTGFAAVDVIIAKRDGRELTGEQIDWVIDAYTGGEVAEEQMSALLMAILLNGMTGAEIARWTTAMIAFRDPAGPVRGGPADRRQALHRRGGGQDLAAAGAAGGRLRGRGAAAVRPRARPHRRHAGQDGVDPGLAGDAEPGRDDGPAGRGRRGDLRGVGRSGAGRPQAVRAAGRHRHGRVHPDDRRVDHEQEDRRGHRSAGAGRQGRLGRVHEDGRTTPPNWPGPWWNSARGKGSGRRRC